MSQQVPPPPPPPGFQPGMDPKAAAKAAKAYAKASRPWFKKKRWWVIGAIVLIVIIAAASASGGGDSTKVTDGSSKNASPHKSGKHNTSDGGPSFKNGVLTTRDLRIKIIDHKVIPIGQKGNEYGEKPVIAFWYKVTNLSGKKTEPSTAFIMDITAYQDNNPNAENELNVGSLPDDRFLDSQTETIKKGGTVENAIAYELDDLKTPVDLVASDDLGMTKIGKTSYPLK